MKRPLGSDEAAAAATSALVSLAAAWLQAASCFLLPLLLLGLLRTASRSYFLVWSQLKRKLIGCSAPGKTAVYWRLAGWMREVSESESERPRRRRAGLTHLCIKHIFGKARTYRRPTSPSNTSRVRMDPRPSWRLLSAGLFLASS